MNSHKLTLHIKNTEPLSPITSSPIVQILPLQSVAAQEDEANPYVILILKAQEYAVNPFQTLQSTSSWRSSRQPDESCLSEPGAVWC